MPAPLQLAAPVEQGKERTDKLGGVSKVSTISLDSNRV